MSSWHRNNPDLVGTYDDPWMSNADYRRVMDPEPSTALRDGARDDDEREDTDG